MPMKLAICNETFGEMPLTEALALAERHGFTGWEVAPFMLSADRNRFVPAEYSIEARCQYRQQVEQAGLNVIGLHWLLAKTEGFHLTKPEVTIRRRTAKRIGELAKLCRDLGGDLMVLGSPQQRSYPIGQSESSAMDNAAEVLRWCLPQLEDSSVRIAIEPLGRSEGNFLNTAALGRRLIEQVDSPWVRLHLDVKAMSDESISIDQNIRDHADLMIHFHANDPNLLGPGMGDVDYRPIMAALHEVQYDGWISVEVFDYRLGAERILQESRDNLLRATALIQGR
jgi:sugar phosphate isomerase/epimerase